MESRGLVVGLVVALGVCLLVIGIFIGRESARPEPPLPVAPAGAPPAATKPLPPIFEPPPPPATSSKRPPPAPPPRSAPVDSEEKRQVAQYFRDVDRLQNVDVDDPQASAQALVNAAASGDTSGLQKLLAQARSAEAQARALTPPPPCAAYHGKLLSVLGNSQQMLQKLAASLGSGNLDGLTSLLSSANAEKERAETLARDEKELKRRYGL